MASTDALGTARAARINWVALWLYVIAALIVAMVMVGGLTRLTDSGLSITEWKPVTGAIPPLGDAAWRDEFAKYQQIPEYQRQNLGMSLDAFKAIYWWEWSHRLLGRLIGMAFALPLIAFWVFGMIPKGFKARLVVVFLLGGLQGAVGWWMVASGLSDRVDVSQYRLATHLSVALLLLAATWWTALDVRQSVKNGGAPLAWRASRAGLFAAGLFALVCVQIVLGAFVAGLDGGRIATGWPLVDGRLAPETYGALSPFWRNLFDNPVAAQIDHRFAGYLVFLAAVAAPVVLREEAEGTRRLAWAVAAVAVAQVALGITTLVHAAPVGLSAAHQLGAVALFLTALTLARAAGGGASRSAAAASPVR